MGNKSKKQQHQTRPNQHTQQKKAEVTEADKQAIEAAAEESTALAESEGVSVEATLSEASQAKLTEAEKNDDLTMYWNHLKDMNLDLDAVRKKYADKEAGLTEREKQLDIAEDDLKKQRDELSTCQKELNDKWKDVTCRELAMLAGEYPTSVKHILEELENAAKEIQGGTADAVKELTAKARKHLKELLEFGESKAELDTERLRLESERKKLEADQKRLEKKREVFNQMVSDEVVKQFGTRLDELNEEQEELRWKLDREKESHTKAKERIDNIRSRFGLEIEDILRITNELTEERNRLKQELEERPSQTQLDSLRKDNLELERAAKEAQQRIDEKEFLELRQRMNGHETYEFEKTALKDQAETLSNRIKAVEQTIKVKDELIKQLQGETQNTDAAFECIAKWDADENMRTPLSSRKGNKKTAEPQDLKFLVDFVKARLAYPVIEGVKSLYYDDQTLRTFLAGLHMAPITLLTGNSGTGKTSLAREFVRSLLSDGRFNGGENDPFEIVAVQSGWRDRSDLVGYYNSFEKRYKETDFFRALYRANLPKYKDTLFFIVLDEMNLSRPEHYFADFLSALEQSESERFIRMEGVPAEVYPDIVKANGGRLPIPSNVRFIGTANHDESTLEFAPKTIDRSNLMEMPKNAGRTVVVEPTTTDNISYLWLQEKFGQAEESGVEEFRKFQSFIQNKEVKELFSDKKLGAGNRLDDQAKRFIGVYLAAGGSLAEAADHLITSRILRNLKDKYQFSGEALLTFHAKYEKLFKGAFIQGPKAAEELIADEIKNKEK